jgi:hypothetical protein
MRLLGEVAPKTVEGTMVGNPETIEAPTTPAADEVKNSRREGFFISSSSS